MRNRHRNLIAVILLLLAACGGSEPDASSDSDAATGKVAAIFKDSSFSDYIDFSEDNILVRIEFAFFPDGTNFDLSNNRIILPCTVGGVIPDGVDINLTAPVQPTNCADPLVILVSEEGESMTVEGIVLKMDRDIFAKYGIQITQNGIKNKDSGQMINAQSGKLAEYVIQ